MSEDDKVAEGHTFLLKEDVDPDAQTEDTETPPETDKSGDQDTDKTPKVETDETPPEQDSEDTGPREYTGIKVGDKVYPDEPALVAAYQSLEGTLGRQGNEMGELRAKITEMEGKIPAPDGSDDLEPEYDALDKGKIDIWNGWNTRRIMRTIHAEQKQVEDKRQLENQITTQAATQVEIQTFLEENQDLSVGDVLKITRLVGEKGMSHKDALATIKNGQAKPKTEDGKADKLTRDKQDAADEGGKNLSEGGGAAKTGINLDDLSPEEWGEAKKNMKKSEIEAHLAGEDMD